MATHKAARAKVQEALENALKSAASNAVSSPPSEIAQRNLLHLRLYVGLPPCLCALLYLISLTVNSQPGFYPGLIFSILLLIVGLAINLYVHHLQSYSEESEVRREVEGILYDYKVFLEEADLRSADILGNLPESRAKSREIVSGHPHVSVVTVFRNMHWQRVPVLLLAEGDVIALMGGDITPGLVHELIPTNAATTVDKDIAFAVPGASAQQSWTRGALIERGVKIYLRRSNSGTTPELSPVSPQSHSSDASPSPIASPSASATATSAASSSSTQLPSYERHRSLASDSVELLILSGDIRCFQMAETPIGSFCQNLLERNRSCHDSRRKSLAALFPLFAPKPPIVEPGDNSVQFDLNAQEPLLRNLFYMVVQRGMELMLVTLGLFLLCAVIRLSLAPDARVNWSQSVFVPAATIVVCFLPVSLPLILLIGEALMTADILATTEVVLFGEVEEEESQEGGEGIKRSSSRVSNQPNSSRQSGNSLNKPTNATPQTGDRDDDEFSDDDEFLDEDIDERAEEIADEASTKIHFWRFVQYVGHVLRSRLFARSNLRSITSLPPPKRDENTPGFSSSPFDSPLLPVPLAKTRLVEVLGAVTMVCFVDDDIICEDYSVTEEIFLLHSDDKEEAGRAVGTVLDLHANPEATGSRFEDPLWWKHLPSLKPIGLNAMLTYSPMPPPPVVFRSLPETLGRVTGKKKERLQSFNYMEKSLVGHIRKSIPLENLRELAEEIGLMKVDVDHFSRLLEMNVMAPGLGDVRLVEDTHAWGQEETRRRGSLTSQVRGAVVKDTRGGGLQMMSQGDPSLILNYCREYWDGSSITPLTAADRKEVLAVYDRWDLEDFDVVAFAYSPVPVHLQPLIYQAHGDSNKLGEVNGDDLLSGTRMSDIQTNCLFFVDPRTAADLESLSSASTSAKKIAGVSRKTVKIATEQQSGDMSLSLQVPVWNSLDEANDEGGGATPGRGQGEGDAEGEGEGDGDGEGDGEGGDGEGGEGEGDGLDGEADGDGDADLLLETREHEAYEEAIGNYDIDVSLFGGMEGEGEGEGEGDGEGDGDGDGEGDGDVYSLIGLEEGDKSGQKKDGKASERGEATPASRDSPQSSSPSSSRTGVTNSTPRRTLSDSNLMAGSSPSPLSPGKPKKGRAIAYESAEGSSEDLSELLNDMAMSEQEELYESSVAKTTAESAIGSDVMAKDLPPLVAQLSDNAASLVLDGLRKDGSFRNKSLKNQIVDTPDDIPDDAMTTSTSTTAQLLTSIPLSKSISLDGALSERANINININISKRHPSFTDRVNFDVDETKAPDCSTPTSFAGRNNGERRTAFSLLETKDSTGQDGKSGGGGLTREERRRRMLLIEKRRNSRRVTRSLGASLWHLLRQQVFLGMTASSVPIRPEVPNLMEDLTSAGVRFIYFSARNMRRSKPVAEKIGLQFDWNCAISLRDLQTEDEHDPHRYISNYADWDVHARMPHGIDAIKNHLRVVDNVPLLVSLYTDATPSTTRQMVEVFREYGEVIMTVGAAYRAQNQDIFDVSNIAISVGIFPGKEGQIPSTIDEVLEGFSEFGDECLSKSDLLLTFRLVGLGSTPLLQMPADASIVRKGRCITKSSGDGGGASETEEAPFRLEVLMGDAGATATPQLRLSALLEAIRKGRVFLLNMMQVLAMLCVSVVSLGFWPLVANAVPFIIPPSLPPCIALLFLFVHVPIILFSMLHSPAPEGVLKNTPRKNLVTVRKGDQEHFIIYLLARAGYVALSVFVVGWLTTAHAPSDTSQRPQDLATGAFSQTSDGTFFSTPANLAQFWFVQDTMSCEMLLSLIAQALTLIERGQKVENFPHPISHVYFYLGAAATLVIHAAVMVVRAYFRLSDAGGGDASSSIYGFQQYQQLDYVVWIIMVALPVIGVVIGLALAADDDIGYRRVLHFLRLSFDTRLGMHSPR